MNLVVDTGVFSATLGGRGRQRLDSYVTRLIGHQLFIATQTVAELRFGALVAGWGSARVGRLEESIAEVTVIPVSDALVTRLAELRFACRQIGHPLADPVHASDLWIAASAVHIGASLISADAVFPGAPGLSTLS